MKDSIGNTVNLSPNSPDDRALESLRAIWVDALEKEIEDESRSFFDNGGDSLGAMTVLNRIKLNFNIEISLEDFFNYPTLNELVTIVDLRHQDASSLDIHKLKSTISDSVAASQIDAPK
jgi:acyl carrier protein